MEKASENRVGGPPAVNIPDGFGEVVLPGSKALALVDNIPGSHGGSWIQFVVPQILLGEVGSDLGV